MRANVGAVSGVTRPGRKPSAIKKIRLCLNGSAQAETKVIKIKKKAM